MEHDEGDDSMDDIESHQRVSDIEETCDVKKTPSEEHQKNIQ